ncbi:membrane protein [Alphaproteobacteria bacterium]|nr:membrane protein [Alphaproteobacteria bacterium]
MNAESSDRENEKALPSFGRAQRVVFYARLALMWESVWPLLRPVIAGLLVFCAVILLDIPAFSPFWLQLVFLFLSGAGLFWGLFRLRRAHFPSGGAARRRVETDNALPPWSLDALGDRLVLGKGDPQTEKLWREHQWKLAKSVEKARVRFPKTDMGGRNALGFVVCFCGALAVAGSDAPYRFERAFVQPFAALAGPVPRLQLWITPPSYVKGAPVFLDMKTSGSEVSIAENSALLAELQGGRGNARLVLDRKTSSFEEIGPGSWRLETGIDKTTRLSIRQGWREVASWNIAFLEDAPPSVALLAPPSGDSEGRVHLSFEAGDDHGISRLFASISEPGASDQPPTSIDLPLAGRPVSLKGDRKADVSDHPLAGERVLIALGVGDDFGHESLSDWKEIILPERIFHHPVAKRLAVLRRELLRNAEERGRISGEVRQMAFRTGAYDGDIVVFLALIHASARLKLDFSPKAKDSVALLLWRTVQRLEDGDRPEAARAMEQAAADVQKALEKGISGFELEALMERLEEAAHRYLAAIARDMLKNNPELARSSETSGHLMDMVGQIREMSRLGSTEAAKEMLSRLTSAMDALEEWLKTGPQRIEAAQKMGEALKSITDRQQKMRDEYYAEWKDMPSMRGKSDDLSSPSDLRENKTSGQEYAERQKDLQGDLRNLMGRLEGEPPLSLRQAEREMGDAARALFNEMPDAALFAEDKALAHLREGSKKLATPGGGLRFGFGASLGRDPLGRPQRGGISGEDVEIPTNADMSKAREVLEELRRRVAEPDRPSAERDYLKRLLEKMF